MFGSGVYVYVKNIKLALVGMAEEVCACTLVLSIPTHKVLFISTRFIIVIPVRG
jgi:hypothetical protein